MRIYFFPAHELWRCCPRTSCWPTWIMDWPHWPQNHYRCVRGSQIKSNLFFPANTWILKFFLLSCFFPINMQLLDNIYGWLNLLLEFKCDHFSTLKPRYNEPQYSEFRELVKKTQLPFCGFTKHISFDIVNYSI